MNYFKNVFYSLILILTADCAVYSQYVYKFNTVGAEGMTGPSQEQIDSVYLGTSPEGKVSVLQTGNLFQEVREKNDLGIRARYGNRGFHSGVIGSRNERNVQIEKKRYSSNLDSTDPQIHVTSTPIRKNVFRKCKIGGYMPQ